MEIPFNNRENLLVTGKCADLIAYRFQQLLFEQNKWKYPTPYEVNTKLESLANEFEKTITGPLTGEIFYQKLLEYCNKEQPHFEKKSVTKNPTSTF